MTWKHATVFLLFTVAANLLAIQWVVTEARRDAVEKVIAAAEVEVKSFIVQSAIKGEPIVVTVDGRVAQCQWSEIKSATREPASP